MRFVILIVSGLWKIIAWLARFVTKIPAVYLWWMITGAAASALIEPYLVHKPFWYLGAVLLSILVLWAIPKAIVVIDTKSREVFVQAVIDNDPIVQDGRRIQAMMDEVAKNNLDTHGALRVVTRSRMGAGGVSDED